MNAPANIAPSRPALRWHGGKWMLAPWIITHFPRDHKAYVEPFGGAASVLLRKARSYAEVWNDLDDEVVNFFSVLRKPALSARLMAELELTPFSRVEFNASYEPSGDPVERARRLAIRSHMGFGSDGACGSYRTGFRANSNRSGTTPAHDWANFPAALKQTAERFRGVIIERRDALAVMAAHDGADTLHYCDPPYLHATRSRKNRQRGGGALAVYNHEMSDDDHVRMLDALKELAGMVVLSGYPSPIYDERLGGGLAQNRARGAGRWRASAHRGSLDQSCRPGASSARSLRRRA